MSSPVVGARHEVRQVAGSTRILSVLSRRRAGYPSRHQAAVEPKAFAFAKRALDLVGATIGLLLSLPVLLMAIVAVKAESPGPAIFRQVRVGRAGRRFTLYKLRGMYVNSRELYPELYSYDLAPHEVQSWRFKLRRDPRVTRVGHILRALAIDELPNLINVLKGDMSLVGPRPEIPELVRYYSQRDRDVLSVRPGVTSPAKVSGRDRLTFRETLELDLQYVRNRSLWLDIKTILKTLPVVLTLRDVFDVSLGDRELSNPPT